MEYDYIYIVSIDEDDGNGPIVVISDPSGKTTRFVVGEDAERISELLKGEKK